MAPPPGEYEVNQYDIQTQVQKKAEAGANNPAISNLKMKRGDKGVFISGSDRFQEKKPKDSEEYIGPGLYEVAGSLAKKGANQNQNVKFLANEVRFKPLPQEKEKLAIPGPTSYQNEEQNNWFKRSYNMLFTE